MSKGRGDRPRDIAQQMLQDDAMDPEKQTITMAAHLQAVRFWTVMLACVLKKFGIDSEDKQVLVTDKDQLMIQGQGVMLSGFEAKDGRKGFVMFVAGEEWKGKKGETSEEVTVGVVEPVIPPDHRLVLSEEEIQRLKKLPSAPDAPEKGGLLSDGTTGQSKEATRDKGADQLVKRYSWLGEEIN